MCCEKQDSGGTGLAGASDLGISAGGDFSGDDGTGVKQRVKQRGKRGKKQKKSTPGCLV